MERTLKNTVMLAAALAMVLVLAISANAQFGGCGINLGPVLGCLPSAMSKNMTISTPCCKVFRTVDLSCLCPFQFDMPSASFEPLFAIGAATGCFLPTPFICT